MNWTLGLGQRLSNLVFMFARHWRATLSAKVDYMVIIVCTISQIAVSTGLYRANTSNFILLCFCFVCFIDVFFVHSQALIALVGLHISPII